jgi:hypothetical protein
VKDRTPLAISAMMPPFALGVSHTPRALARDEPLARHSPVDEITGESGG